MKQALLDTPDAEHHDNKENNEKISIGTIVSNLAHPYTLSNTNVLITTYAHFTPPLMVVVEKNFGISYNAASGEKEDNGSYKCLHYSTIHGSFELNWFKGREIKTIKEVDNSVVISNKDKTIEALKKEYLGKMVTLTSVDLELEKTKIWSDNNSEFAKMKTNNLLDFLPPLASVIDVKYNEDYRKFNEKDGKIIHSKCKILFKVRWLNNITSKYSEEYIPLVALKTIDINLKNYNVTALYCEVSKIELEENATMNIKAVPFKFQDVIWKHYYYIYRFKNLFTNQLLNFKDESLHKIKELKIEEYAEGKLIFDSSSLKYVNILGFFKTENKTSFEKKWFEIEYLDKGERYSKRIIYIIELIVEDLPSEPNKKRILIKSNCLLRDGKIRHFYVDRISGIREMPNNFETIFVKK